MKTELRSIATTASTLFDSSRAAASLGGALNGCTQLGSLDGACIEKLLVHCASALEENDVTLAQQVMWVLNNVASVAGDPNQRLTSWLLRALVSRASRLCPTAPPSPSCSSERRAMSVTELADYVDLIPWHRFGFCASNGAIFDSVRGCYKVHVLDFSTTHCMQWPTLIDALAKRPEGPPLLRISVQGFRPKVPPLLNVSCEEVGLRLANFAKFRNVPFEFHVIDGINNSIINTTPLEFLLSQINHCSLGLREDEALVVNCQNWLRYLPDEPSGIECSLRDAFLNAVKGLNPRIVVAVDEDSELSSPSLASRIAACFNYLWIPFDAFETFLPKDSKQRIEYEADIGHKIDNVIGFEGIHRIERLESGAALSQRMRSAGFSSVPFCDDTAGEVKGLLDEHASGWGMKREDDMLVLTWKGHNSVFATAWVPS